VLGRKDEISFAIIDCRMNIRDRKKEPVPVCTLSLPGTKPIEAGVVILGTSISLVYNPVSVRRWQKRRKKKTNIFSGEWNGRHNRSIVRA
jgi:hypothetical protein